MKLFYSEQLIPDLVASDAKISLKRVTSNGKIIAVHWMVFVGYKKSSNDIENELFGRLPKAEES